MKRPPRMLMLLGVVFSWLPYLALKLYWEYLLATDPGVAHGEFSGPASYFLPRLLLGAMILTLVLLAASAVSYLE